MKKAFRSILSHLHAFLLFFSLIAFVISCSFLLFFHSMELVESEVREIAPVVFANAIILTLLFFVCDLIRRKITVDRPVRKIQDALDRITSGDFSARLNPTLSRGEFGEIMKSINRMTEELAGVETLRADFIANVSHEMKTPLSVMQNYGTLLQAPDLPHDKRIEYAKAVTDGSRRLAELMTNILKLNRLENQQIYPEAREFDLGEQLCECLLLFENTWEQAEIDIETDIAENVLVHADSELLSLVWNNLFSNAFKFTPRGGRVTLSLSADESGAVVRVADTGCGMSPEVGAHIFEKFYQGDTSHSTRGNGLGLALVKRVVDIVHGEIHVESAPGAGSTFTVKIPRWQNEEA